MAVNLTPLHDRVIVKRIEEKETVKGGIIIPDSAKEKPQEGEVIAVGAGKREKGERIPLDVKVGDRVLFGKYSGSEIKIDGEELPDPPRRRDSREAGRRSQSGQEVTKFRCNWQVPDLAGSAQIWNPGPTFGPGHRKKFRRNEANGKADCYRREFPPGDSTRRECPCGRSKDHPRPQGPQCGDREEVRRADHHQGRRDRGQGNRTARSAREHGRADGPRSRLARPPTSPATAPPPPPFWPRPSSAKA